MEIKSICKVSLLIGFLLLFACKKDNIDRREINVKLQKFNVIDVNSTFDVFLTQDTAFSLKIVGEEKFVNDVVYQVNDNVLSLSVNSGSLWLSPKRNKISVFINCDSLKLLNVNETSMIKTLTPIVTHEFGMIMNGKLNEAELDLAGDVFYYWNIHPCGGKITLKGDVNVLKLWNVGLMEIDALNLTTSAALIENKSKGSCSINVIDKLEYRISGEGNIYLKGNPAEIIENELSSTGRLIVVD